jgi:6-pyruvoyltetrahydropterin/6-carboxytetrahydropterin synthase
MEHVRPEEPRKAKAIVVPREVYRSTKTYDHSEGLSCCFRQWRAPSHCRLVHGYALAFKFVFATDRLDERHWCFDFGGLKPIRAWLHDTFDHTMIVVAAYVAGETDGRVWLESVEVREHGGNAASYER